MRTYSLFTSITVIALATASSASALSPQYKFSIVAKSGDTIAGRNLSSVCGPAINNSGTVAFTGELASGTGLFTKSQLLVETGDVVAGVTLTSIHFSSLLGFNCVLGFNDLGAVAFSGSFNPPQGPPPVNVMFTIFPSGEQLATFGGHNVAMPSINNAGQLVFYSTPGGSVPESWGRNSRRTGGLCQRPR
jgi:hypothetical protein